ncbi:MAG TPA: hypothetical protein VJ997_14425 [Longimicrobiales bacterium]|nr:hypothetical protein [Longimicrobiales bacterium]
MSGRARKILSRFPAHMEAYPIQPDAAGGVAGAGKQFIHVSDSLAGDLDLLSMEMAAIRRAHRLGEADVLPDLLLLGGLHGFGAAEISILLQRFTLARELRGALAEAVDGSDTAGRDAVGAEVVALWGVRAAEIGLQMFAPEVEAGEPLDLEEAGNAALIALETSLRYRRLLGGVRARVAGVARIHARGNGTVRALLEGAANALDMDMGPVEHSTSRFWHAAVATDRLRLDRPPGSEAGPSFQPAQEVIGLEENPRRRQESAKVARRHGELFSLVRKGFDRALLQVRIFGRGGRTVGPLFVNRDEGHGVGFAESVPDGSTLVFGEGGRVLLDDEDVTARAFGWTGACFAGEDAAAARDFVFDGPGVASSAKTATFATAVPPGALRPSFEFPHDGRSIETPGLGVGETRFAFFVRTAHFSRRDSVAPPEITLVTPRTAVGFFDGSVFAAAPPEVPDPAADVQLSWLEHEAYAVRLLIPARFRALDVEGAPLAPRLVASIDRFRPAGVHVRVDYVDERWILGTGALLEDRGTSVVDRLRSGTVLWAAPSE